MTKSASAFRTISEVADWLGVQTHVLRFWESKFPQVKPVKRAGGRRYYRPADMMLLGGIKKLLHDDGVTIKGAQKMLREQGVPHISSLSQPIAPDDDTIEGSAVEQDRPAPAAPTPDTPTPDPAPADTPPLDTTAAEAAQQGDQIALFDFNTAPAQESPKKPDMRVAKPVPTAESDDTVQPDLLPGDTDPADAVAVTTPGILSYAARLRDLSGVDQAEIAQLAQQLRAVLNDAQNARTD